MNQRDAYDLAKVLCELAKELKAQIDKLDERLKVIEKEPRKSFARKLKDKQ